MAFAIGRKVGTAVVRNRLRRRLRSAFVDLAAGGGVSSGAYLITAGARATELTYEELRSDVRTVLEALGADVTRGRADA